MTHPDGHSHEVVEAPASLAGVNLPQDWSSCEEYLQGIDLFNRAFFWEAHEAWEAVWLAAGADTVIGRFLQGLIQASAALLKRHVAMQAGARSLLAKSRRNLQPATQWLQAADRERFMGICLVRWQQRLEGHLEDESEPFPFLDPSP